MINYLHVLKVIAVAGLVYWGYSVGYSTRDNEILASEVKSLNALIEQDRQAIARYTADVTITIDMMRKHAESQLHDMQAMQVIATKDISEVNRIETEATKLPVGCIFANDDIRLYNDGIGIIKPPTN